MRAFPLLLLVISVLVSPILGCELVAQGLSRVVIDPGHGGRDGGSRSASNSHNEKDLNLQIARELGALLAQRRGIEIIYTRTDDTYVSLTRRGQMANELNADLFISVHCNSMPKERFGSHRISGFEVFVLGDNGKDEHLKYIVERENREYGIAAETKGEMDMFEDLLNTITQEEYLQQSEMLQNEIFKQFAKKESPIKAKSKKQANFKVLRNAAMPAVLVEVGFLSNLHDEAVLTSEEGRSQVVYQLYKGVALYDDRLRVLNADNAFVSKGDSQVYRIQLSSYVSQKDHSIFRLGDLAGSLIELHEDGLYRYFYGSFNTREAAEYDLEYLKKNGYPDAFIRKMQ